MINNVKYIVDSSGKTREVIVPVQLWNRLSIAKKGRRKKMMDRNHLNKYIGVLNLSLDPLKFQKMLRDEWS